MLENWLGIKMESFSYPFGQWDAESVEIVASAGFKQAVVTQPGMITGEVPRFRMHRIAAGNWTAQELAQRLKKWQPEFE